VLTGLFQLVIFIFFGRALYEKTPKSSHSQEDKAARVKKEHVELGCAWAGQGEKVVGGSRERASPKLQQCLLHISR